MSKPVFTFLFLVIIFGLTASDARAGVYKCVGPDGGITYSQTPCPGQKSEAVQTSARTGGSDAVDCSHANRFALKTAKTMRTGTTSAQIFARYGGLDSLSKGTLGIINYVYGFRSNNDVSVERIASLTQAKCRARSLGDVSCEALPLSYSEPLGGCDADENDTDEAAVSTRTEASSAAAASTQPNTLSQKTINNNSRAANEAAREREEQSHVRCKESKRKAIDAINARMRSAYSSAQGESYRERLRELRKQLRDC